MMMSLFSVFDPVVFSLQLNWMSMLLVFLFFPFSYFFSVSNVVSVKKMFLCMIKMSFREMASSDHLGLSMMATVIFFFLILANLLGLYPFVFSFTSHPLCTLGWGMVMWLSFMMMGWLKNFKHSAAHLVPLGCPIILAPILVFIEIISHLIRPITISIRLAANIMAGHLIVGLLSSISSLSMTSMMISVFFQSVLMVLEISVAVIQGFVFSILLVLYALDFY
uniref:ATP synthase subunit a n=1 Tax=Hypochilus thorelli TaxID=139869 RepID=B2CKT5_HYPTH|nr:ATP synthase F0 subunit 6 [Hypochilus thorelli]ACA62647.1 ATP synthase subunit 6 [Hypochilus thorelli]